MIRNWYYVLDEEGVPQGVKDVKQWGAWMETNTDKRIVGKYRRDNWLVSTMFLGIDHRSLSDGPPLLYETMTFNPNGDGDGTERYSTRDDALIGHERHVRNLNIKLDAA